MTEWQPAYQVAELVTIASSEQTGAPSNIPPPPMAIVAVQAQFEKRDANSDDPSLPKAPPPPVDRYPAIAAAVPAHVTRAIQAAQAASARAAEMKRPRVARAARSGRGGPDAFGAPHAQPVNDDDAETWVAKPASIRLGEPTAAHAGVHGVPTTAAAKAGTAVRPDLPPTSTRSAAPPPPPRRTMPSRPPPGLLLPSVDVAVANGLPHPPLTGMPKGSSADAADDVLPSFPLDDTDGADPTRKGERASAPNGRSTADTSPRRGPAAAPSARMQAVLPELRARIERAAAFARAHPRDPRVLLGVGGGLVVLLVIAVAALAGARKSDETPPRSAAPPVSSLPAARPETMPPPRKAVAVARERPATAPPAMCRVMSSPARLAARAWKDAPLELRVGPGDTARLGFASDPYNAQGVSFHLNSLEPSTELAIRAGGKVRAVVPLAASDRGFALSAEGKGDTLTGWYPVSAAPPLVVGWADGAVAAAESPTATPHALWAMDGDDVPDAFRAADGRDAGIALVFRRRGGIFAGWIDRDRQAKGALAQVFGAGSPPGSPVGSPVVATSGDSIGIAFADRDSPEHPWGLWLGTAPLGSLPKQATDFPVPPGGPGGASFAPALTGLSDGRWLLAWTEGTGGKHDVRAQTLSSDLTPIGPPLTVSGSLGNAGQAAVAVTDGQGAVVYLALTGHAYEVWGAHLDCR
jgi:hypothetical protein